jgi:hypothetical protein
LGLFSNVPKANLRRISRKPVVFRIEIQVFSVFIKSYYLHFLVKILGGFSVLFSIIFLFSFESAWRVIFGSLKVVFLGSGSRRGCVF